MRASIAIALLALSGCVLKSRNAYYQEIDQARTIGYLEHKAGLTRDEFVDRILYERCGETWGDYGGDELPGAKK